MDDAALLKASGNAAFVREIELTCDGRPWVFAQTLVPQATLLRQAWLATLGRAALGERLAAVPGIERGPLEFARLVDSNHLYQRALRERRAALPPSGRGVPGSRLKVTACWCRKYSCPKRTRERRASGRSRVQAGVEAARPARRVPTRSAGPCANTRD